MVGIFAEITVPVRFFVLNDLAGYSRGSMPENMASQQHELFGHPVGLFTLFFAEMWERFSYYGMRALLVFYMIKGFLGLNDQGAYDVYGAYTALVYATPFLGGMFADRLLGQRRAVVVGGILMAAGHLMMTWEAETGFYVALALLIVGNGFFKPNISTMVGMLYPGRGGRRDGGFTIFYMGINLGAAVSPLLCGYVGETYGWHYGFGLATIGMLLGLATFVMPNRISQILIGIGAFGTAASLFFFLGTVYQTVLNAFVALALVTAGVITVVALGRGGLHTAIGQPKDPSRLHRRLIGPLRVEWVVYLGIIASIPLIALLVQRSTLAGAALMAFGGVAFLSLLITTFRSPKVWRERMFVVLILMFFSMLFWAFFEQAGSSLNNFADRNVDRVAQERVLTQADVGSTVTFRISQEQLGYRVPLSPATAKWVAGEYNKVLQKARSKASRMEGAAKQATLDRIEHAAERAREALGATTVSALVNGTRLMTIDLLGWIREAENRAKRGDDAVAEGVTTQVRLRVTAEHVGMGVGGGGAPASIFLSANPVFIMLFGLVFTALWGFLSARGSEPSTPIKFALGLLQLGLGFGALWLGAQTADGRGMVAVGWLLLGYLLHTTGELCISPVGLSMVTKLAPPRMVSTVMGAWFLAMAFSNYLAGMIARFTGVSHGSADVQMVPPPSESVHIYGDVFGKIAITAMVAAALCFALAPILRRWMHQDVVDAPEYASESVQSQ